MGLLAAVRSSLRLLGEFPRPRHSESRIRWNTVFIHPVCRPARFYPAWEYETLAVIWIFVAGTLWWYLLSLAGQALLKRFLRRDSLRS